MPEDTLQKSQMPQASTMPVFSVRQPRLLWATSSHRILGLSVVSTKKRVGALIGERKRQRVHCDSTTAISNMVMREGDRFVDFKAFKAVIQDSGLSGHTKFNMRYQSPIYLVISPSAGGQLPLPSLCSTIR